MYIFYFAGLGEPSYFYVESVFALHGLMMFVFLLFGVYLRYFYYSFFTKCIYHKIFIAYYSVMRQGFVNIIIEMTKRWIKVTWWLVTL